MRCDIIETMPWQCDDNNCDAPGGWHKGSYWIDGKGYTFDEFSDGDHEGIDEEDIPKHEEVKKAWDEYAKWVIQNGTDPLGEYYVKYTRKVKERWSIKVRRSICGMVVSEIRRGRTSVPARKDSLPQHLAEYLNLLPGRVLVLGDFTTTEGLAEVGIKLGRWHTFTIEREVERPAAKVTAELRKIARRNLRKG